MLSSLKLVKWLVQKSGLFWLVIFCLWPLLAMAQAHAAPGSVSFARVAASQQDPLVEAAFDHFYNLDYDRAIQEFEKVLDRHPADPAAVNHLLTTILMRELYRMGAMNSGEYADRK